MGNENKEYLNISRRAALLKGVALLGGGAVAMNASTNTSSNGFADYMGQGYDDLGYADSTKMLLPKTPMKLKRDSIGLVLVNPQIDFLSPKGLGWSIYGASIKENKTLENIVLLLRVAKSLRLPTFVTYVVWNKQDLETLGNTPMKNFIRGVKIAYTQGVGLSGNDISDTGADFMPELKPMILDNSTVLTTPRKDFGLIGSDLIAQIRTKGVRQIILCGMDANTHVDSHLRTLLGEGFEVGVVRDATAGAKLPEGDGYLAGLINFRFLANELFWTKDVVQRMQNS
ncbi:cysteine hydrolase [Helicobacter muridarum]|uniref:Cysteine hydrolase n=1 Tax=Helicobacter muridarum TaxID=216 RepID=A0A099TWN2_9HELI|nr:isochorismatase family cysteine hydrolase [Helicobacter muridarum]TLE00359.1 cysteine hydrolase [Helicobacter muridarum]STQ85868.1 Isochorismatase family [Helicobacter muridarum]